MENYYALILAGGGGTRLWPLSRKDKPKQMLALTDEQTMFRTTVTRLQPLLPPEKVYVVSGQQYVAELRADVPEIPAENFIAEPYGKNNAPAVGLALTMIQKQNPDATVAMLTSDHHISKAEKFRGILETAYHVAQSNHIVTLGITPTFPATGFGYIRQGNPLEQTFDFNVYHSRGFVEKPDQEKAVKFLLSGEYTWNSGMFIWNIKQAMQEFDRQQPEMANLFKRLQPTIGTSQFDPTLAEIWEQMPTVSIDYAIMEGAEKMAVIPAEVGWSDVGSWASLFDILDSDENGNCIIDGNGKQIVYESQNTLICSDRMVVTIGVENLVIVDTDDVILVCHKEQSQNVRKIVEQLKTEGEKGYL